MNELQELIEESATRLFEDFSNSNGHELMEAGQFPDALWADFLADGWLTTLLSEEEGGSGLGLAGGCVLMRLAGYHKVPLPVVESLMAVYLAAKSGVECTDEFIVPVVMTEALTDQSDIKLYGVPWARYASSLLVVFKNNNQTQVSIIKSQDITITPSQNMAGEPRDDVMFDVAKLKNANNLQGISIQQIESWLALSRAAQMAGALQRVLEMTVDFANERSQFGRPIGKFQAVQQQMAVLAEMTSASICAVDAAIDHLGSEQEWELIACAKITSGESAGYAAKTAHAVHAAIGFTQEYPLQLSTRRLWSWRDEYGNEAQWSAKLGRHCFDLETDDLWSWLTTQTG
ncbi:MAG: acyl-CoA dehydrogenase family protein [Cycloclasticus sp.]|nr:acyl-CoA dehydrogenase family protein [Cycloclasticus sp.]